MRCLCIKRIVLIPPVAMSRAGVVLLALCACVWAPVGRGEFALCNTGTAPTCCAGYYINVNVGTNTQGSDACLPCPTGSYCGLGTRTPKLCNPPNCAFGLYSVTCRSDLSSLCTQCATCPSGTWRKGCTGSSAGACVSCSTCPVGSRVTTDCSALADVVCEGLPCSESNTSMCGELFCNASVYGNKSGVCTPCPVGWGVKAGHCVPCPDGLSCNEQGKPVCEGDCPGGMYATCDLASGYVECTTCLTPVPDHMVGVRGGVLDRSDLCHAYTECMAGYVMTLVRGDTFFDTVRTCVPCASAGNTPVRFLTPGMSNGNPYSCMSGPTVIGTSSNVIGAWGNNSDTCEVYYTSVAGATRSSSGCVPCPPVPQNAESTPKRSDSCEFVCKGNDDYRKTGLLCVPVHPTTCEPGFVASYSGLSLSCSPTPLPWNLPGFYTNSVVASVSHPLGVSLLAFDPATGTSVTEAHQAGNFVPYLLATGPQYAYVYMSSTSEVYETHTVRQELAGVMVRNWTLPGRVCSSAVGVDDAGHSYLYMCLCGMPFVAFLDVSRTDVSEPADVSVRVDVAPLLSLLTGSVVETGWADGLRDQARFGTVLSVAVAPIRSLWGAHRLFVMDHFPFLSSSCRLVEVGVGVPGAFVNRAMSVDMGGVTLSTSQGTSRLLTPVLNGRFLLFLVDEGLYQFDTSTYSFQLAIASDLVPLGTRWFGVADASDQNAAGSVLQAWTSDTLFEISRSQEHCVDGYSSTLGSGVCTACPARYYASSSRGITQCTLCNASLSCPVGTFLSQCTAGADAKCLPCEMYPGVDLVSPSYSWTNTSTCVPVYRSPCPDGYWGSNLCTKCPENTHTPRVGEASSLTGCVCDHCGYRLNGSASCVIPSPYAINRSETATHTDCTPTELVRLYTTSVQWADWNGCPRVSGSQNGSSAGSGGTMCARVCVSDDATCTECGSSGMYLAQYFPRICKECPNGTFGGDGLRCTECPPLRVSAVDHTFCMCSRGTVFSAPDSCVCPAGHEVRYDATTSNWECAPCRPGFYHSSQTVVPTTLAGLSGGLPKCVPCDAGTEAVGAGATQCVPCADGMYNAAGQPRCTACDGRGRYASDPKTALSCVACDTSCGVGFRSEPCPLQPEGSRYVRCVPCTPPSDTYELLGANSWEWTTGARECMWKCKDEKFHFIDEDMQCARCTDPDSVSCTLGMTVAPCGRFRDANCVPCVNETMPSLNAEWDPGSPCHWRCVHGYEVLTKVYDGWSERSCVQRTEGDWDWWLPL